MKKLPNVKLSTILRLTTLVFNIFLLAEIEVPMLLKGQDPKMYVYIGVLSMILCEAIISINKGKFD